MYFSIFRSLNSLIYLISTCIPGIVDQLMEATAVERIILTKKASTMSSSSLLLGNEFASLSEAAEEQVDT